MATINKITLPDGSSYDIKDNISNMGKWNDVELTKTSSYPSSDIYIPFLSSNTATSANLTPALDSATTGGSLVRRNSSGYIRASTPPSNGNSNNVTTVGYVNSAIANKADAATTLAGYGITDGQQTLVSGTNIKTINGTSILGSGDITISSGLQNLVDGTATGSIRQINAVDSTSYPLGQNAAAFGDNTTAMGNYSHAEGQTTYAVGACSHAEGNATVAEGNNSHTNGYYTSATTRSQTVIGEFNVEDSNGTAATRGDYVFIIGNGTSTSARSNALAVKWTGDVEVAGNVQISGTPTNSTDAATKGYVDNAIPVITLNGTASTSPSFYAPTTAGTSDQVLTSNGSGAPIWAAAPSDSRLVTNNVTELEAGYNSTYDTFNLNWINDNGDGISINGLGATGEPALTYLPSNDWSQANEYGKFVFRDSSGDVHINGDYYSGNGKIGERLLHEPANDMTTKSGYYHYGSGSTYLASLTLGSGVWIIMYAVRWNTSNTTGVRRSFLSTVAGNSFEGTTTAPDAVSLISYENAYPYNANQYIYTKGQWIASLTSSTTFKVVLYQSSNANLVARSRMAAVRIA